MRRRFVIGVEPLNNEQEEMFRKYIATKGAWWHWINNLWLMTTTSKDARASEIRDRLLEINPKARVVVFEFPEDVTWAASASKNDEGKKMADWLRTPWGDAG